MRPRLISFSSFGNCWCVIRLRIATLPLHRLSLSLSSSPLSPTSDLPISSHSFPLSLRNFSPLSSLPAHSPAVSLSIASIPPFPSRIHFPSIHCFISHPDLSILPFLSPLFLHSFPSPLLICPLFLPLRWTFSPKSVQCPRSNSKIGDICYFCSWPRCSSHVTIFCRTSVQPAAKRWFIAHCWLQGL